MNTLEDTQAERDCLIEKVYPLLKNYCRKEYDLEFEITGMTWNVQSIDHSNGRICFDEIESCVNDSIGPGFIVSLSFKVFPEKNLTKSNLDLNQGLFKSFVWQLRVTNVHVCR
jgi:hypothetical protein